MKPTKLNILGKPISIEWKNEKPKNELHRNDAIGKSYAHAGKLILSKGLSPAQSRDTVLHEALHFYDYDLKLGLDEETVQRVAVCIYQLLRDNKEFARWLLK